MTIIVVYGRGYASFSVHNIWLRERIGTTRRIIGRMTIVTKAGFLDTPELP